MKTYAQHLTDVKKEYPTAKIQSADSEARDMNETELADWHDLCAKHRVMQDEIDLQHNLVQSKKQSAKNKLSALGLDADEITALLG
jgi:hypothetical protein